MEQVTQNYRSGELRLAEIPPPAPRPGSIMVATRASLVSAGTEKMLMDLAKASLIGKSMARPDLVRQVVDKARREGIAETWAKVRSKLETPVPLGYSCCGRVLELAAGVSDFQIGDRVACAGAGYANHAAVNSVPKNLCVPVPDGVADEEAAFVTVGAIALQGVRQATPTLGERMVVIGLGLIGLLTVQLLKANGCRVLGYDPNPARVALACELGADAATAADLVGASRRFTDGRGADAVIICASTKSDEPVRVAGEVARLKGRIVLVGLVGTSFPRDLYYRKELDLRLSMSYGPGRYDPNYEEGGVDYPFAYVRWTEQRNMQAFLELVADGRVTPKALITHRFDIADAMEAYALLASDQPYLGIVLTYPERAPEALVSGRRLALRALPAAEPGRHARAVGFIGAGNFATGVLLPTLGKMRGIRLTGVATATGLSAENAARRFGFSFVTTDPDALLADDATGTVFIVTRHHLHAPLAIRALQAGKNVFVEKPLALDRTQLNELVEALATTGGRLTVGFNRRFSPLLRQARATLAEQGGPLVMLYRVNAGAVPAESWLHGAEGGGRIIGEVCHFVDVMQFLTDAAPVRVQASRVRGLDDALSVTLDFADGSVGTIVYSSLGERALAKEYIEVLASDVAITIDDFRSMQLYRNGRRKQIRSGRQDKGFAAELEAFFRSLDQGEPMPIPLESLVATTETTFAIEEALRRGTPVALPG